jgi:predicted DNA binding protein
MSANALALEFGVHRTSIVRTLQNAGVEVRYRILTDDEVNEARAAYEAGLSLATVGEQFGVAARTLLNAFRKAGVRTRPVGSNQWTR